MQQEMEQKDERLKQVMAQYKMQQAECLMLRDELKIERHAHMLYMDKKIRLFWGDPRRTRGRPTGNTGAFHSTE